MVLTSPPLSLLRPSGQIFYFVGTSPTQRRRRKVARPKEGGGQAAPPEWVGVEGKQHYPKGGGEAITQLN